MEQKDLEYYRKWRAENKDKVRKANLKFKANHRKEARLYYREWYKAHGRTRTQHDTEVIQEWIRSNPDGHLAHIELNKAVKSGQIVKPTVCSKCNRSVRIHAHHDDYSKPLDVLWLCASCHKIQHLP